MKSARNRTSTSVLFTAITCCGPAASADVLFSNFGPDDTYDLTFGWTLSYGGPLGGDVYEDAVAFTVTGGDYWFDSAEVAVNNFFGPDIVYFNLHADADGVPGDVLDSTSATGTTPPGEHNPPMLADFGGDTLLLEGRTYWLALRTEETDALLSWAFNIMDDFGLRAWQLNNGPWHPVYGDPNTDSERGVFRINGTLVPAPGAISLLGVTGVVARRRRR